MSTDLRWFGHDEKCFRFEILGCKQDVVANSELFTKAEAPGYLTVSWLPPVVSIPNKDNFSLNGHYYLLNLTHDEGDTTKSEIHNTTDTSFAVPSPLWGSRYTISLVCWHHHLPVKCGVSYLTAVPQISSSCRAHSSFCQEEERIRFVSPEYLTAKLLINNSVHVKWRLGERGWRAPSRLVRVEQKTGERIYEKESLLEDQQIFLENLNKLESYSLVFCPNGDGVPSEIGSVRLELSILPLREPGDWGAFISDVSLQASVDWRGSIVVEWREGRATGSFQENDMVQFKYKTADSYKLTLRIGEGENYFTSNNKLSSQLFYFIK